MSFDIPFPSSFLFLSSYCILSFFSPCFCVPLPAGSALSMGTIERARPRPSWASLGINSCLGEGQQPPELAVLPPISFDTARPEAAGLPAFSPNKPVRSQRWCCWWRKLVCVGCLVGWPGSESQHINPLADSHSNMFVISGFGPDVYNVW